tara:strand:+ start:10642 stop:12726 length:2085 start_codon:yes stop_codon:yes gene_type:complete
MADTFDSRLKLRLQESGGNSGQWGTLLNQTVTNIASVFGYGTHQLSNNADATLTLSDDGASIDALKASYLKITSAVSLTATRTLTFAPNTLNQVKYIENATSGSQSITISQGSGANVTIESGATKVVYFDGAGSGAAVVDALANIDQGTAEFDTIKVATIQANDGTGSATIANSTGVMTIASSVLTTTDINGGTADSLVIGASTPAAGTFSSVTTRAGGVIEAKRADDARNIKLFNDNDFGTLKTSSDPILIDGQSYVRLDVGSTEVARLTSTGIDVTGSVTASGTLQADRITANGVGSSNYAVYGLQNSSMTHAGYFQANGDDIAIEAIATGGTYSSDVLYVRQSSLSTGGNLARFANSTGDKVVITTAGSVGIGVTPSAWHSSWKALQLGPIGFVGSYQASTTDITALGSNVYSDGTYKYIETDEAVIYKQQNGQHIFDVAASGSANAAISWTTAMTIDNSANVGIGESDNSGYLAPDLVVVAKAQNGGITVKSSSTSHAGTLAFADATSGTAAYDGYIQYEHNNRALTLASAGSEAMRIDQNGAVTKPKQPAFSATRSGSDVSFNANTTTVIPFQSEIFDQNADYNTSTYQFTAPVTGKYQFNLIVRLNDIDESADYYILYIRTSNRNYYHIFDSGCFDLDPNYYTTQVTVLADMDSGDQAWGEVYQTNGANQSSIDGGNGSNSFSGYLVA